MDSPTCGGRGATVTTSSARACSSVTSTVISFVMLAIGSRSRACALRSTSPVAGFSTSQALASGRGGAAERWAREREGDRGGGEKPELHDAQAAHRQPTRMRWPTFSAAGSMPGFSVSRVSTVVPCSFAIEVERVAGLDPVELRGLPPWCPSRLRAGGPAAVVTAGRRRGRRCPARQRVAHSDDRERRAASSAAGAATRASQRRATALITPLPAREAPRPRARAATPPHLRPSASRLPPRGRRR